MPAAAPYCACCLAPERLRALHPGGDSPARDHAHALKSFFSIKLFLHEADRHDSYICEDCARRLQEAQEFKQKVMETIRVLQVNGLIKTRKGKGGYLIVKKIHPEISDMSENDDEFHTEVLDESLFEVDINENIDNIETIDEFENPAGEIGDANGNNDLLSENVLGMDNVISVADIMKDSETVACTKEDLHDLCVFDNSKVINQGIANEICIEEDVMYDLQVKTENYDDFYMENIQKYEAKQEVLEELILNENTLKQEQIVITKAVKGENIEHNVSKVVQINSGKELIETILDQFPLQESEEQKEKYILKPHKKRIVIPKEKHSKATPLYAVNDNFKCEECGEMLPNLITFHTHMNAHFPNHICETCGKKFSSIKKLKRHIPSHQKGPFVCTNCNAVFTNYNTFNSHRQRKHSERKLYKCTVCDERFVTFHRRMLHLADTHGQDEKKYKCKFCSMQFLVSGNLSAHMRRKHLNIKLHYCPHCGMGFYLKQDLQSHIPVHTGVKAYHCTVCNKSFPRKKTLAVHLKIHTNDKRYGCDVCGRKFTQKITLQCHLKVHEKRDGYGDELNFNKKNYGHQRRRLWLQIY